ncbi:MAG: NADH-quinone oxidoreductase subunit L [Sedimentisphaerales bacterium]|jgi:NADH-quinone oxidoreductase subunit L
MLEFLWLVPVLPLAGFAALVLLGKRITNPVVACISVGSVGLSAIFAAIAGISFIMSPPAGNGYSQTLWTWIQVGNFSPAASFYLDALSVVMMLVVTFIGLLIIIYSTAFMAADEDYRRFFAYMNLFIASMLILVLADNLVFLYLGWEGVGLCSYLLIGFWYKNSQNGLAAIKAFLVTRIGDTAMAIGLFLLFATFGTLDIQLLSQKISQYPVGSTTLILAASLLLAGAIGKSAQLPLQVWLPDAMAGPTPVSALIHAATMVAAGVYLIARTNFIFINAPAVMTIVAIIGVVTLLIAGFSALVQHDIKRVLAYSTISQIGYMFLALGVGAWSAAIFHFMVHAFFKSLLFLCAGVVITAMSGVHDIFKMGGLRRKLPLTFWAFLIGCASLSALPLVTAGFYSKDMILWQVWSSPSGGPVLWAAGLVGALLTSLYAFRVIFIVFFGEPKTAVDYKPAWRISAVLVILAFLSIVGGFIKLPMELEKLSVQAQYVFQAIAGVTSLAGILFAYLLFAGERRFVRSLLNSKLCVILRDLWFADWGFDWLYNNLLVRPYQWLAFINRDDFIDSIYDATAALCGFCNKVLSASVNGNLRWYVSGIVIGSIIIIAFVVLL